METLVQGTFPVLVIGASLLTIVWLVQVGSGLMRSRWAVDGAAAQGTAAA